MSASSPAARVLVAGAGVAGLESVLALQALARDRRAGAQPRADHAVVDLAGAPGRHQLLDRDRRPSGRHRDGMDVGVGEVAVPISVR